MTRLIAHDLAHDLADVAEAADDLELALELLECAEPEYGDSLDGVGRFSSTRTFNRVHQLLVSQAR